MAHSSADEPPEAPFIVLGTARLPRCIAGEAPGTIMVELVLDARDGCILDVASTIPLPGYTAMLRRLLVGRRLDEVEAVARDLCTRYQGPLLKPTVAALANAVSNSKDRTQDPGLAVTGLPR